MTSQSDFAEAARAEAERRWARLPKQGGNTLSLGKRFGFVVGAKWARTHLPAQEPDGERAVRELHRRIPLYEHEALCGALHDDEHVEAHHHEDVGSAGDYYCDLMPVGAVCDTCRDEDGERLDWPCATIQALDSARAARRDEEKR